MMPTRHARRAHSMAHVPMKCAHDDGRAHVMNSQWANLTNLNARQMASAAHHDMSTAAPLARCARMHMAQCDCCNCHARVHTERARAREGGGVTAEQDGKRDRSVCTACMIAERAHSAHTHHCSFARVCGPSTNDKRAQALQKKTKFAFSTWPDD